MPVKTLLPQKERRVIDFDAIRLKIASPEEILSWSHGEVTKPETINYRTQRAEKDGLFDERIFGPTRDFECYCGKYKRIRYKGIVCEKCGVEVTRSIVRRERMGHISLASPVTHIWFLKGVPSRIGLLLDLSVHDLEKVVYFASYIITGVNEDLRQKAINQVKDEYKQKKSQIESDFKQKISRVKGDGSLDTKQKQEQIKTLEESLEKELEMLSDAKDTALKELSELRVKQIISESTYFDLSVKYGHIFDAKIGAEAIKQLLEEIDLEDLVRDLENRLKSTPKSQIKKINKRLKIAKNLLKNNLRPEWMVLTVIPVIPPELRPMVPLDGTRFATSDLNDLYRRVINRNNRLKKLLDLNAPEVIIRNEKRMLQEAVDALLDNSARQGKTVAASTGQKRPLKSLADSLKGKQGRFRQNLLGKRTDYSARSVIVVGPHLKLNQCGIPKIMALELFKPFIISQLIRREIVHNIKSASRFIESGAPEVWDILEEIVRNSFVLLNRAPTLHRLSIQAFQPILIEGKAIQLHPLVCPPFNADFDGDQMAVHLPLTKEAREEAEKMMLSVNNLLKPANGNPIIKPHQDIIWGAYYLTYIPSRFNENGDDVESLDEKNLKYYASKDEVVLAYDNKYIKLQEPVSVRINGKRVITTAGRIIFNSVIPEGIKYINETMTSSRLSQLVSQIILEKDRETSVKFLDDLKDLSFKYLTRSGLSWAMSDLPDIPEKEEILKQVEAEVQEVNRQYEDGLLTRDERHMKVINLWMEAKDKVAALIRKNIDKESPVYTVIDSKARGSWEQITQMAGMKGNVVNPSGMFIELPVRSSFKEGLNVLEYFISTHGARKGLSDTALKTANAGYLTRRLIDVAQDIIVDEEDCGDEEGFDIFRSESQEMNLKFVGRLRGRFLADDVKDPNSGEIIAQRGTLVDDKLAKKIDESGVEAVKIRSIMTCKSLYRVCQKCYGWDMSYNRLVELGTAVGVMAAQSIGEPGTQLTMRTFHTGGVAGVDITAGLPRVEEIFEARSIKNPAIIAPFDGQVFVKYDQVTRQKTVKIKGNKISYEIIKASQDDLDRLEVKDGQKVKKGQLLYVDKDKNEITSPIAGEVMVSEEGSDVVIKIASSRETEKEFQIPQGFGLLVEDGDLVSKGDPITEGSVDLHELYHLKGINAVRRYVLKEILRIYTSQGQDLNEKHIEIIIRKMFSRALIDNPGDTEFLPGEIVELGKAIEENRKVREAGKKEATYFRLLMGITNVSLTIDSWLSAASFQETARVLIDAATSGKIDYLRGLKENVIIGRLIPSGTGFRKRLQQEQEQISDDKSQIEQNEE